MNKRDELISVLLDGECSPEELDQVLGACEESAALRERYGRWCLVRDALQGARVGRSSTGFIASVMAGLDKPSAASVVRHPARLSRRLRWRPSAGLALAASLGALFTVGVTHWTGGAPSGAATTASAAQVRASSVALSSDPHPLKAVTETQWGRLTPKDQVRLRDYVLEDSSDHVGTVIGSDSFNYARMAAQAGTEPGAGSP